MDELVYKIWQIVSGDGSSYICHREAEAVALLEAFRAATLKKAADRVRTSQHVYAEDCDGTTEPYPAIAVEDAIAAIMEEPK